MAFSDLQLVDADDLNNFAPTGNVTIGGTLGVTGATTLAALSATTIAATGTITATGGKVAFPAAQSASADANTLDDYEEGDWTPIIGGTGGTAGQTYTTQTGKYTKIGKLVIAEFDVTINNPGTITTAAMLGGLPFTVETTCGGGHISYWANLVSGVGALTFRPVTATTYAALYYTNNTIATVLALTPGHIQATTQLAGAIIYRATA